MLPILYGHSQGCPRRDPFLVSFRLGHPRPGLGHHLDGVLNPPVREVTCEFITGSTPEEIAETLADKILAEKVL